MSYRYLSLGISALLVAGCEVHSVLFVTETPPPAPAAVTSITADGAVYLAWEATSPAQIDHYRIYRSPMADAPFEYLDWTTETGYVDFAVQNGVTYFYAVSAMSLGGSESPLSRVVGDTPRPEGYDLVLFELGTRPDRSAFDFSALSRVAFDDPESDVFVECAPGGALLLWAAGPGTDLQDMGYTHSLDDITVSPSDGWNPVGSTLLIEGHTYVVWTHDNHFAKLRAVEVATTWTRLDWAYQVDPGNPELVKPAHDSAYGRRPTALQLDRTASEADSDHQVSAIDSHTAGTRGARLLR